MCPARVLQTDYRHTVAGRIRDIVIARLVKGRELIESGDPGQTRRRRRSIVSRAERHCIWSLRCAEVVHDEKDLGG